MTATARRAKKSFKEDQLVTATVRASEWAQDHFNQVIIGVVALVAAVAVLVFVANSRQSNAREGERLMGSAMTLMQQGDLNAARTSFEQIYQRQGGTHAVAARFFKAECELKLANYERAAADYGEYIKRKDDYPVFTSAALIGEGLAYQGARQWSDAAKSFEGALAVIDREDPRYYDTAFNLASCYEQANNRSDALKYYDLVAEHASGQLRDRARIAGAALK